MVNLKRQYERILEPFRVIPMGTIPVSKNRKSCLGPVFLSIYKFWINTVSDNFMSDGYFHIFLTDESK